MNTLNKLRNKSAKSEIALGLVISLFLLVIGRAEAQTQTFPPSLVSYWNFDESDSGDTNALDQIDINHGSLLSGVNRVEGLVGAGAANFGNSSSNAISVGSGNGNNFAVTTGISLEFLIQPSWNGSNYDHLFRKDDAGATRILLSFQNDNYNGSAVPAVAAGPVLSFGLKVNGTYSELDMPLDGASGRPTLAELTDGNAHHLVTTYDSVSGEKAIYIDGTLRFSTNLGAGNLISSGGGAGAIIGNWAGTGHGYAGNLDEVAFYNAALSASEVADHNSRILSGFDYFADDITAPTVVSITPATVGPTDATSVDFEVAFSEDVSGFLGGDEVAIIHDGTAHTDVSISGGPEVYTVNVDGISGEGSFTLAVMLDEDVIDSAFNDLISSVTSAPVLIGEPVVEEEVVEAEEEAVESSSEALAESSAEELVEEVVEIVGGQVRIGNVGVVLVEGTSVSRAVSGGLAPYTVEVRDNTAVTATVEEDILVFHGKAPGGTSFTVTDAQGQTARSSVTVMAMANVVESLHTMDSDGNASSAIISGSSTGREGVNFSNDGNYVTGDSVEIVATIVPESHHVGEVANIFVAVADAADPESFLLLDSAGEYAPYGGDSMAVFAELELEAENLVHITGVGEIELTAGSAGTYDFYVAYQLLSGGVVYFNSEPITVSISE